MGTGASKSTDEGGSQGMGEEEERNQAGGQLYVSLKMENYKRKGDLIPHVYGSVPLVGSWDSSKAVILSLSLSLFCSLCLIQYDTIQYKESSATCLIVCFDDCFV